VPDQTAPSQTSAASQTTPSRTLGVVLYLSVGFTLITLLAWTVQDGARRIRSWAASSTSNWGSGRRGRRAGTSATMSPQQAQAESLLARMASGDSAAASQVLEESNRWIGTTERTAKANQLVNATLNQHDLRFRAAALQATLALDGVTRDADGLNRLELAVVDPSTQAWALWMLGALGNRGVEQSRIVQTLKVYLDKSDARTRSEAVDGLGIVGSDETVPILLGRFHNDSSPLVQESAARNLAEAGMYTREQRMVAAASFVEWMDDAQMSPQQRGWLAHALRDISGQNFGMDAAAWRQWCKGAR
jgi:HEAT repeats